MSTNTLGWRLNVLLMAFFYSFVSLNVVTSDTKPVFNAAVCSSNEFTMDLFKVLSDEFSNMFFSPVSISIAFAMTYLGCRENTAVQLAKAMHWEQIKGDLLNKDMEKFIDILGKVSDSNNTVTLANRFWIQKSFTILDTYQQALRTFYHSTSAEADFVGKTEEVRVEINDWVEENTRGKIRDVIGKIILSAMTKVVLVNAIYFKGVWKNEFDEKKTSDGIFHVTKDDHKQIPMMSRTGDYYFGVNEQLDAQVLVLPYTNDELSMILVLPRDIEGLSEVEQKVTLETLTLSLCLLRKTQLDVFIPKFKLTSQFELSNILPKMGVVDLFDVSLADLSGITGKKDLSVSNVIHKAFVEVNEKGTEAAAATVVVINKPSLRPRFIANHPFLFFIQENSTGAILFMGRLREPSG